MGLSTYQFILIWTILGKIGWDIPIVITNILPWSKEIKITHFSKTFILASRTNL